MATVTPRSTRELEQDRQKIQSPLARLRKYIHTYVSLEGLALVGLFLTLWFWIGLVLDYGFFKLFLVDWVQDLPWGVRCGVLVVGIAFLLALLVATVLVRLLREFSDSAMALLLEKRFPKELGDRLITAVELSDPRAAAAIGYSPVMLQETIREAAEKVDQVPLTGVFRWDRLVRRGLLIALLSVGLYFLVGAGFCVARQVTGQGKPLVGFGDFTEVATIWTERNILLRNVIWPRRSYLEVLPWQTSELGEGGSLEEGELRIPQGTAPPALRVRAWKYIVADGNSTEGWRLLRWSDVQESPDLAGGVDVPALVEAWKPRDEKTGMTVDEVELLVEQTPIRRAAAEEQLPARWLIASTTEESGWRPLQWSDLNKERLAGLDVPGVPGAWDPKGVLTMGAAVPGMNPINMVPRLLVGPQYISLTVDEVEDRLQKAQPEMRGVAAITEVFERLSQIQKLRETLDGISETAGRRDMRRTMRKLIVPDLVTLNYTNLSGRSTSSSSMTRVANNEYTGNFSELKESILYTVQGEDYSTKRRQITVVERPRIELFESDEQRPAYLYYRPVEGLSALELRGKRQLLEPIRLSTSGETTTMEVPTGTTLTLRGTLSKPLQNIKAVPEAKFEKSYSAEEIQGPLEDGRSFRLRIPDVRREQRFKILFLDNDGVAGERKVTILPREDVSPRLREFGPEEMIRKGQAGEGYVVAVGCRIPFKGKIADDNGLGRVRYACRVAPAENLAALEAFKKLSVVAVPMVTTVPLSALSAAAYLNAHDLALTRLTADAFSPEQYLELPGFQDAVKNHKPGNDLTEFLPREDVLTRLEQRKKEPYRKLFREYTLAPDPWLAAITDSKTPEDLHRPSEWLKAQTSPLSSDLPLWQLTWRDREGKDLPLRDTDLSKTQKVYVVEIRLLSEDTFIEGELDPKTGQPIPHIVPSSETYTFKVVPESVLLGRIIEEEDLRYNELLKVLKPLSDALAKIRTIRETLSGSEVEKTDAESKKAIDGLLKSFTDFCDTTNDTLKTTHIDIKGVNTAYERIIKEMRVNQVEVDVLKKKYENIARPLYELSENQVDRTYNAVTNLRQALVEAKGNLTTQRSLSDRATTEMNELVTQVNKILTAMEGLSQLNNLIKALAEIEANQADLEARVKRVLTGRIREFLEKD